MNGDAIDEFLRRQRIRVLSHPRPDAGRPASGVAIVACMDPRINPDRLFDLRPGEAYVIRNAGGTVTDDVLRSLLLSQLELGTEEVMLLHHTDCAMTRIDEAAVLSRILEESGYSPAFPLLAFADAEADLRDSMLRVAACPFLPQRGGIRGFMYDVVSGHLQEVTAW